MCNLSQGIKEDGIALGKEMGVVSVIITMHNNGFTAEQIAAATSKDVTEIEAILKEEELALV